MADGSTSAGNVDAEALAPDIIPSGSGFRAVLKTDGQIVWSCPHIHFTEHSARNCPAQRERLAAT